MPFLRDLPASGFIPIQDFRFGATDKDTLSFRAVQYGCRVMDRDAFGRWLIEPNTIGDVLCATIIKPGESDRYGNAPRSIAGIAYAWPMVNKPTSAVTTPGANGGPLTPDTKRPGGAVPSGQRVVTDSGIRRDDVTVEVYPCRDAKYGGDGRFETTKIVMDGTFPDFHKGALGIVISATEEGRQIPLYFPTDPRLIAVNWSGNPASASLVCDLQADGSVDPTRTARLHSQFRVVKKPSGKIAFYDNLLSLNYAPAGRDSFPGFGAVFDEADRSISSIRTSPEGTTYVSMLFDGKETPSFATGLMSRKKASGPVDVGRPGGDQHEIGIDADGHRVNSAHISTDAYFRRKGSNGTEFDGPVDFEREYWKDPGPHPYRARGHIRWDPLAKHPFLDTEAEGKWKVITEFTYEVGGGKPPPPTTPPVPPPIPPREPPQTPRDPPIGPPGSPGTPTTPSNPAPRDPPPNPGLYPPPRVPGDPKPPQKPSTGGGSGSLPLYPNPRSGGGVIPGSPPSTEPYEPPPEKPPPPPPPFPVPVPSGKYGPGVHPEKHPKQGIVSGTKVIRPLGLPSDAIPWPGRMMPLDRPVIVAPTGFSAPSQEMARPWNPEDGKDVEHRTNLSTTFPAILYRANSATAGTPNFKATTDPELASYFNRTNPIVAREEAYAGQFQDGEFLYTQRPCKGRYEGGTANGGTVLLPPELSLDDAGNVFVRPGLGSLSTIYRLTGPGVYQGAGMPKLTNGSMKSGYRWGIPVTTDASAGFLRFEQVDQTGAATEVFGGNASAQFRIREGGGTVLTFSGTLADGEYLMRDGSTLVGGTPGGGPPSGAAGGDLSGTYPNPSIADGVITKAKLDSQDVVDVKRSVDVSVTSTIESDYSRVVKGPYSVSGTLVVNGAITVL